MIILGEKEFESEIEGSFSLLLFSNYYASLKILHPKQFENTIEKILTLSDTGHEWFMFFFIFKIE